MLEEFLTILYKVAKFVLRILSRLAFFFFFPFLWFLVFSSVSVTDKLSIRLSGSVSLKIDFRIERG